MLRVQCPHCERRYRTILEACGRTAICTKCNKTFKIGESRPAFEWKSKELAEDSWIGVPPPEEKKELKHCIICDAPLPPDAIRCPECGANQITGVVHRAKVEPPRQRVTIGSIIPLRMIILLALLACIGLGGYYAILAITRSAIEVGDQLSDQSLVGRAAKILRDGGDEWDIRSRFAGKVTQENLPRFIKVLSAGDPYYRDAARALIACGNITDIQPLMQWIKAENSDGTRMLQAISAKRLIELSSTGQQAAREAAAEGLCMLNGLNCEAITLHFLSGSASEQEKIARLNELCRPWPEAVGSFVVRINEDEAELPATVEQVGRVFYLKAGSGEFQTIPGAREFVIPIERWCAATGPAVDVAGVRDLLSGSVRLASPLGVAWQGTITLGAKRELTELPGFLPITPPSPGDNTTTEIRLERPRH